MAAAATGAAETKELWAKGTGYGHGRGRSAEVWDPKASMAVRHLSSFSPPFIDLPLPFHGLCFFFAFVATTLPFLCGPQAQEHHDNQLKTVLQQLLTCLRGLGRSDERERNFVLDSSLVPFLAHEVGQSSFHELFQRNSYITTILNAVTYCYELPWLHAELRPLGNKLASLTSQASNFQRATAVRQQHLNERQAFWL